MTHLKWPHKELQFLALLHEINFTASEVAEHGPLISQIYKTTIIRLIINITDFILGDSEGDIHHSNYNNMFMWAI